MKIGVLGPIWHNIPPGGYGGTEVVVYNLVNSLATNKTNEVYLFGPKTSEIKAHLIPTVDKPLMEMDMLKPWEDINYTLNHIKMAFDMIDEFDILHVQLNRYQDYQALQLAVNSKTPVLFTPHFLLPDNLVYPERAEYLAKYSFLPFSSISDSQRSHSKLNFVGTVYNGINLPDFKFRDRAEDYFAWLGKIEPEKGTREAIQAAKKANVQLYLAGPYDKDSSESLKYFENEVKPLIDGTQIKWFGEVDFEKKCNIVGGAKALLNPLQWEEPFGLVMVEAQALGTPVISFVRGAAPELIEEGKSGYLVNDVDGMVIKMKDVDRLDRLQVRKNAEKFSAENMAKGYEEVYGKVIDNWNIYLKNSKIGDL